MQVEKKVFLLFAVFWVSFYATIKYSGVHNLKQSLASNVTPWDMFVPISAFLILLGF